MAVADMMHKRMLIEEAHRKIKDMILNQELAPGQKLTYNELASTFDMSPTPVINALHRLEHEGFVSSTPFRGFCVRKIELEEAWDLFGVREALETHVVEQVILRAEKTDLFLLEEKLAAHAAYRPEVYDRKRFMLDSEFHIGLASICRNEVLTRQLATTLEHFYVRFRFDSMSLERLESSVEEHRQIIDRIRRRDVNGSREAMRNHIQSARNHVIQTLSEEQPSARVWARPGSRP